MKRVALVFLAAIAAFAAAPNGAQAAACKLPAKKPLWIDFADGSVPFWTIFAKPGVIAAASNFLFPPQLRALGAKTIYWDMHLPNRVGTPTEPFDPALVIERANRLYEYAAASMACSTPMMAENELFGAGTLTPWSASNALYRANVLLYLRTLAQRGAVPALLVSSTPYTGGEAGDWWRAVSRAAHIVREVYFPAPMLHKQGPILGSRTMRVAFRRGAGDFLSIGVPPSRLGLMLGFHTTPGFGGRERLQPAAAWFEVVKLQALAAKQVAHDLRLGSIWSWGWGVWSQGESDPDKPAAACVWLWTRDAKLCDAQGAAGPAFNPNRTEGQLIFPRGVRCTVAGRPVRSGVIAGLTRVIGDAQAAFTAAYARAVVAESGELDPDDIRAAERAVVAMRFAGNYGSYRAALRRARASVTTARGVIGDELRRGRIQSRLRVASPSAAAIQSYYETYSTASARFVVASPAPAWLGHRTRGWALSTTAPPQIFALSPGRTSVVRTMVGKYKVRVFGPTVQLGELPLTAVRSAIAAALVELAREDAYQDWLLARENRLLRQTICWRDQLPAAEVVALTDYLPFLALDASGRSPSGDSAARQAGG